MDGEEAHELVEALAHSAIELRERLQVSPNFGFLIDGLSQETPGDDELDVVACDEDLGEAVFDPVKRGGHELETWIVEEHLLQAGDDAKAQVLRDFADLAQEAEIEHELLVLARAQEV